MRRRDFIAAFGSAATIPIVARAQERVRRIGILMQLAAADSTAQLRIALFEGALQALGWVEGRNLQLDRRWAAFDAEQAKRFAKELIGLRPDVIVAQGTLAVTTLARETNTIPIIFTNVSDPVGDGFVASFSRPGGNVTGFANYEYTIGSKWLGLLKEIAPNVARVAVVMQATNPASQQHLKTIQSAAPSLGLAVHPMVLGSANDTERKLEAFSGSPNGGLIVLPGAARGEMRGVIFRVATQRQLPAIYANKEDAVDGGLMSYGIDPIRQHGTAASYVDRVLRGERPADLPIQQPTNYMLVINVKTAKALGLEIRPTLLARADEVIE